MAQFIFKNRMHLGIVKAHDDLLLLNQLRYQSEIRKTADLKIPTKDKVSTQEINMAIKLIDQLVKPFDPKKYKDTYAQELKAIIQAKLKRKKGAALRRSKRALKRERS